MQCVASYKPKVTAGCSLQQGCFSLDLALLVQLGGRHLLRIKNLSIGDRAAVLVGKDKFQPVYAFERKAVSKSKFFIQIFIEEAAL